MNSTIQPSMTTPRMRAYSLVPSTASNLGSVAAGAGTALGWSTLLRTDLHIDGTGVGATSVDAHRGAGVAVAEQAAPPRGEPR